MTMLDNMRRHKAWLKWSLGLVVVTFVLLYVPSFLQTGGPTANDTIATVEGRPVKAGDFRTMYAQQLDAYRQAYGANLNDQLLKQLGLEQRLIQQMIDEARKHIDNHSAEEAKRRMAQNEQARRQALAALLADRLGGSEGGADAALVIVAAAVLSCFTAGMSLALSAANVYLRDLKYLWSIVSQAWFFSTPIVYPISRVEGRIPDWAFQIYANLPMAVVVRVFRHLLYDLSIPPLVDWGLMLGYSLAMLFAGWWVFRRLEGRFAEEL